MNDDFLYIRLKDPVKILKIFNSYNRLKVIKLLGKYKFLPQGFPFCFEFEKIFLRKIKLERINGGKIYDDIRKVLTNKDIVEYITYNESNHQHSGTSGYSGSVAISGITGSYSVAFGSSNMTTSYGYVYGVNTTGINNVAFGYKSGHFCSARSP